MELVYQARDAYAFRWASLDYNCNFMSAADLSARIRAMSHSSIRKRLLRTNSEERKQSVKNSTSQGFRPEFKPKFERMLQENKLEFIMNIDPNAKVNLFYNTHISDMEKELGDVKKSLSTMVARTRAKEAGINRLKSELARIDRDIATIRGEEETHKNKVVAVIKESSKKKEDMQQKGWHEKSYKNIRERAAKDEEFLRRRHALKEGEVQQLRHKMKGLQNTLISISQSNARLSQNVERARQISKEQAQWKNQFIELLNEEKVEKDDLNRLKVQKIEREGEIKQLMPSVIEKEELQKYLEIMFTHKLLSQIIKVKSQRLIEKYSKVQKAYLHIKSNTNILELAKILSRMQNQDHEYESLLKKVDALEKELLEMQTDMVKAVQREHEILSMGDSEQARALSTQYQGVEKDQYEALLREKEKLLDRKTEEDILKKKIIIWAAEHAALFEIDSRIQNEQEDFFMQLRMLQVSMKRRIQKPLQ